MSLQLFFDPLETKAVQTLLGNTKGFTKHLDLNHQAFPQTETADIALLSVAEFRGSKPSSTPNSNALIKQVREYLYGLSDLSEAVKVVDLGHLRLGETYTDTRERLSQVCQWLMAENTLPVVIGGSHDLGYAQYCAYEGLEKIISVLNVDAQLDLDETAEIPAERHLHELLMHRPNFLFEYVHMGHQRYLVAQKALATLQKLNFDMRSVGQLRDDFRESEPLIRAADMLMFDTAALRGSHVFAEGCPSPFGLSPEEGCQICWYAGISDKLSSAGFYTAPPAAADILSAQALAVMIWYFLEGFCHRKQEYSFSSNFHIKYTVALDAQAENLAKSLHVSELVFYKSKISDRWWMEVTPQAAKGDNLERGMIVPCSYQDYEQASSGQVPDRWIKAVERL